jgi:hypothetical protein
MGVWTKAGRGWLARYTREGLKTKLTPAGEALGKVHDRTGRVMDRVWARIERATMPGAVATANMLRKAAAEFEALAAEAEATGWPD